MYIKDTGSFRPKQRMQQQQMQPQQYEQLQNMNGMQQGMQGVQGGYQQPVIYIINQDSGRGGGFRGVRNYGWNRGYGGGGGFFGGLFRFVYTVRSIISFVLIAGIVILVVTVVSNPQVLNNFFENILRRLGLYNALRNAGRLFR